MQPYRAILVDIETSQPICQEWTPTIWPSELEAANERLAEMQLRWRWRQLDRILSLHGSVTMQAAASNAVI